MKNPKENAMLTVTHEDRPIVDRLLDEFEPTAASALDSVALPLLPNRLGVLPTMPADENELVPLVLGGDEPFGLQFGLEPPTMAVWPTGVYDPDLQIYVPSKEDMESGEEWDWHVDPIYNEGTTQLLWTVFGTPVPGCAAKSDVTADELPD
jgi:hypothetical protein